MNFTLFDHQTSNLFKFLDELETEKVMSFLPVDMGSRLPSLITHSPRGRAAGCCGPQEASPLDHTGSRPPAQRARL